MDRKMRILVIKRQRQLGLVTLSSRAKHCCAVAVLFVTAYLLLVLYSLRNWLDLIFSQLTKYQHIIRPSSPIWGDLTPHKLPQFRLCSVNTLLDTGLPFLTAASPLPASEFIARRNNLARALFEDGVDAFVAEPGFAFQYYTNVSQKDWEPWEPEERPFLMVVRPRKKIVMGSVKAKVEDAVEVEAVTSFLVPNFEVERVRLLGMPFESDLDITSWEEHWNPYATLRKSWLDDTHPIGGGSMQPAEKPKLMVDEEMRDFIQRGLSSNGFEVVGLGGEVERVRQIKTEREINILRAVNTGTVEAVRAVRKCLYPGLTENMVMEALDITLRAAGLEPFFDIVLFDQDASNPHGGTNGSKILETETFVLIDVGAHLHGYSSDITRTFYPPFFPESPSIATINPSPSPFLNLKLQIWNLVLAAQSASLTALQPNNTAASVDIAAREVITEAGYGPYFTHRLGHGIGIKAHESPYLNKGNVNVTLRAGMVFTSEPGVYLEDRFGVRHEDVFLVKEHGGPEVLSGRRATSPWDP